jgi:hypothetical protein
VALPDLVRGYGFVVAASRVLGIVALPHLVPDMGTALSSRRRATPDLVRGYGFVVASSCAARSRTHVGTALSSRRRALPDLVPTWVRFRPSFNDERPVLGHRQATGQQDSRRDLPMRTFLHCVRFRALFCLTTLPSVDASS